MVKAKLLWRWLPLVVIVVVFAVVAYQGWYRYFTFDQLQRHHHQLQTVVEQHYGLVVISFIALYVVVVAVSIPGAVILTLASGLLFGIVFGTLYVVFSATVGACCLFLAVRTALASYFVRKADTWIGRMEQGFRKGALSYILFLRLVPLFPFWIVNIVPALLDVKLSVFAVATFFGIIPGTMIYVWIGSNLNHFLTKQQTPDIGIIFEPKVLLPLLLIAVLALVPVCYKKLIHRQK